MASTTAASVVSVSTPAGSSVSDEPDSTTLHDQSPLSHSQNDALSASQTPQHMGAAIVLPSPAASSANPNTPSRITTHGSGTAGQNAIIGEMNTLLQMNGCRNIQLQSKRNLDPKLVQFTPEAGSTGNNKMFTQSKTRIHNNKNKPQGKSPSSTADSKPIVHIASVSSPLIFSPKVQKMTTPVVTKNDNNTLHVKHSEQVDPNIGQMTPKQNASHVAVADGMFLSPFFLSPESKLATVSGSNINIGDSSLDAVAKSDFEKQDFSDSATFDGQYILPWLSPSANGMFLLPSGDISSITPSKSANQTPKISKLISATCFENHDSSLTLPFEKMTSRNNTNICISPLTRRITALTQEKELGSETPINFNEVFASPKPENTQFRIKHHEIPDILYSSNSTGEETPLKKSLTEQQTREDEDLNTLLKLAETTPRGSKNVGITKANARIFRGKGFTFPAPERGRIAPPPSSLHLPFIGTEQYSTTDIDIGKVSHTTLKNTNKDSAITKKRRLMDETSSTNPSASGKCSRSVGPVTHYKDPQSMYPPPTYIPPGMTVKRSASAKKIKSSLPRAQPSVSTSVIVSGSDSNKANTQKKSLPTTPSKKMTLGKNPETPKSTTKGRGPGKKKNKQKTPSPLKGEDAELLRGVTQRPSGKWQAQMYFAGKSRYIGVFDTREKAATAYEIARDHLKNKTFKDTDTQVNAARKAAFAGVNEDFPNSK